MADENADITTEDKKHTMSGIVSVVMTVVGLLMLIVFKTMGISSTDETGFSITFVLYLFISMAFAIVGGFFGAMGITEDNAKKTLPIIGLILAGIFTALLTIIIVTSVSLGT
jgi:hypothetical protein